MYNKKSLPNEMGISRRDVLELLLALGVAGIAITSNPVKRYIQGMLWKHYAPETEYFTALKLRNGLYVQKNVFGKEMVFEVVEEKPREGTGMQYLVQNVNPFTFDHGQLQEVADLAKQLYENPKLTNLKPGKIGKIHYEPKKEVEPQRDYFYPVPKYREDIKSLEELVKK